MGSFFDRLVGWSGIVSSFDALSPRQKANICRAIATVGIVVFILAALTFIKNFI